MYINTIQQQDKETAAQFDQAINRYMVDTALKGDQVSNVTFLATGTRLTAVFVLYTKAEIEQMHQKQIEQQRAENRNGLIRTLD